MNSTVYNILNHAHSGLRWVVLLLLVLGIAAFFGAKSKGTFTEGNRKLALFGLISTHIQLVIGFILYFTGGHIARLGELGMGNKMARFYGMEHVLMMVIGIAIITFGYSSAKRMSDASKKGGRLAWTYLIGLILILSRIPWPFMEGLNGSWF